MLVMATLKCNSSLKMLLLFVCVRITNLLDNFSYKKCYFIMRKNIANSNSYAVLEQAQRHVTGRAYGESSIFFLPSHLLNTKTHDHLLSFSYPQVFLVFDFCLHEQFQ